VHANRATISADAGGGLLHRRGYRKATAKAPIRETLAATLLRAADWRLDEPLADPMCGSGTFLIEAAWMAQDRAPGRGKTPPSVSWPAFPKHLWRQMSQEADRPLRPVEVRLWGRDRDPGAIKATRANADRAGVRQILSLHHGMLDEPWPELQGQPQGLVVLNPPYGIRVADRSRINGLYDKFGQGLRRTFPGWRLAAICPRPELARRLTPQIEEITTFKNGGLNVGFYGGLIPSS
jgi:putative N6-adenine-specific DNA methylase